MRAIGFILLCWVFAPLYGQTDSYQKAQSLYTKATVWFESDTPTPETDRKALAAYAQARTLLESLHRKDTLYADSWLKTGALYETQEEYPSALSSYRKALSAWKPLKPTPSVARGLFTTYTLLCQVFYKTEQYDSVLYHGKQAEQYIGQIHQADLLQRFYNTLGALHHQHGNFQQSIFYLEKAFAIARQQKHVHAEQLCRYLFNIGAASGSLGQYTRALQAYQTALQYKHAQEIIYRNMGEVYQKRNMPDSALYYLQRSSQIDKPINQMVVWNHIGDVYQKLGRYTEASTYYQKSIQLNEQAPRRRNVIYARSHIGLGEIAEARYMYPEALAAYQKALHTLHPSFSLTDIQHTPTHVENVLYPMDFMVVLTHKARALQRSWKPGQKPDILQNALANYQLALHYAEQLRISYDTDEAKLFFTDQLFPVYQEAVQTAYHLYKHTQKNTYAEHAFFLSEKSKAAVLAESLHGLQLTHTAHLPTTLLQQERKIKQKITRLALADMQPNDSIRQSQLRDARIQLSELIRKMDTNEKYYQLKYSTSPLQLDQLRKRLLTPKTALIEYFWTDTQLFAFVVTSEHLHVQALPADKEFYTALKKYQYSLFNHQFSFEQSQWAHTLYRKLFAPLSDWLSGISHLIVVPDGQLCYLPLESLVSDPETETYLLEGYIFRYAYSATVLEFTTRHHLAQPTAGTLAMAPFAGQYGRTFRTASLSPLPASKEEVEKIGGRIYLESQATKQVFLKMASSHGVIHLATHAKADSEKPINSYISFYPQQSDSIAGYRLYTAELYNMELEHVQLVVLSGCETGGGQLVRGEGVMSLARAFAYAGCPNIVMTLWRAEDWATAQITTRMHEYLQKGYGKDEALTRAKRDYLRDAPASRKNPYFWANFVLVGDSEPVYPSRNWVYWLGGVFGLLLVAAIYLRLKRTQADILPA